MPSRVVRSEINRSESLSNVSPYAELTFRALLTEVDDYGRFDARPKALKAALFPLRDEFTAAMIFLWVMELHNEGCVQIYTGTDGRAYLQLSGWEKHRGSAKRAEKSKYPDSLAPGESPEIRGILGDPSEGMESRVSNRESVEEESRTAKPAPDAVRKPRKVSAPETHPEALEFAAKFIRALGAAHQDPPIKLPTDSAFAGWQREARLMLTTDGRSFDDAKRVASWLFNDQSQAAHFWRKNVLSVGTFRKQFDRLAAAMKAPHHGGRDEFHGSKILRYLATAEAGDPRPRASGAVQDPEPPILRLAELPAGER